ncbi:MAG: hypothetical protein AAFR84_16810 [Pseudomonadota bacterium]
MSEDLPSLDTFLQIIRDHFDVSGRGREQIIKHAVRLRHAVRDTALLGQMGAHNDAATLASIQTQIGKLRKKMNSLTEIPAKRIDDGMRNEMLPAGDRSLNDWNIPLSPDDALALIQRGCEEAQRRIEVLNEIGLTPTKADLPKAALAGRCRIVWGNLHGKLAPKAVKTAVDPLRTSYYGAGNESRDTPFWRFIKAVFLAHGFNEESIERALRNWEDLQQSELNLTG